MEARMSLLSLCQNAADNLGVSKPATIIGNTSPAAQRFLQAARREAINLYRRADWSALVTEYVFIANGGSDYQLPFDFDHMIDDTLWDRTRFWRMRGAMSPQQWQLYKSSIIGRATIERRWRIRVPSGALAGGGGVGLKNSSSGNVITDATVTAPPMVFSIDPLIGSSDITSEFVFEYVSKHWCVSGTNFFIDQVVSMPSGSVFPTQRPNFSLADILPVPTGINYAIGDQFNITNNPAAVLPATCIVTGITNTGAISTAEVLSPGNFTSNFTGGPGGSAAATTITGIGSGATFILNFQNGAGQADWMADTDTSLIDENLIELGVIWRIARRLGLAYDEERDEYETQVRLAIARDGGSAILNLAPYDRLTLVGPYNVQEGNFPG
jgi:hypothetical protein